MPLTRLDEPADYAEQRELRLAEFDLMRQREKVAALRRRLPPGPPVQDDAFLEGPRLLADGDEPVTTVRLSELFTSADRALVGDNSFQYDFGAEDEAGELNSTVSVFTLDPDGSPRHFYSVHPQMPDDVDRRGIDLLSPVWHVLDLTPQGRGDWFAGLDY